MKRFALLFLTSLIAISSFAQKANKKEKSSKKNGNHIIMVGKTEISYNLHKGKLNGKYKQIDANNVETSGFIINNKEHSQWTSYYPSGKKWADVGFRHGKKHGLWRIWNEDETLQFEYEYNNGTPVGLWKEYDAKGIVIAYAQK